MNQKKGKILVTGGAGYIGSHTAKLLDQQGEAVVVFDNLSRGHKELLKWGTFVLGDLKDRALILDVLREYDIRSVIHFAAYAYVGESMQDPGLYYANNVGSTINLLNAMIDADVKNIVFSSTCSSYGNPKKLPISEDHPQNPINPYGKSKWMIEQILKDFDQAYGLKFMALRYFNAAGADPEGETGELHEPETHLIPNILKAAQNSGAEFNIWGDDYDTPDGTCIRDYIHVSDLAQAHVQALAWLFEYQRSNCLNLGTGRGYSVREVVEEVQKITGREIHSIVKPRRPGDPPSLVADPSKAKEELHWQAKCSDLQNILETAWRWQNRHEL